MVTTRRDEADFLTGAKAICAYAMISEATLWRRMRDQGFPVRKVGGVLVSSRRLINRWTELVALGATVDQIEAWREAELESLTNGGARPRRRARATRR